MVRHRPSHAACTVDVPDGLVGRRAGRAAPARFLRRGGTFGLDRDALAGKVKWTVRLAPARTGPERVNRLRKNG